MVFGAAVPAATTLQIDVPPDGVVNAADWPSACTLLADDEIKGLLPQADKIQRRPQPVTVVAPLFSGARNETAPEGGCTYAFELAGATSEGVLSSIGITIDGIADPALGTRYYTDMQAEDRARKDVQPVEDRKAELGPEACYTKLDGSRIEWYVVCGRDELIFEVTGLGFGIFEGGPRERDAERDHWRDNVQVPVVGMIAGKVRWALRFSGIVSITNG